MQIKMSRISKLGGFLKNYFLGTEIRDACRNERRIYREIIQTKAILDFRLHESKLVEEFCGPRWRNIINLSEAGLIAASVITREPIFAICTAPVEGLRFLFYKVGKSYIQDSEQLTSRVKDAYLKSEKERTGRKSRGRIIVVQEEEIGRWDDTDGYEGWLNAENDYGTE